MNKIVLDTETANTLEEPIMYDIGWAILDDNDNIIATRSFVVAEIFLDKELMSSAYFADKIPQYWKEIKLKIRKLAKLSTIIYAFRKDCKNFNITEVYAHNAFFDCTATNLTNRYITCSKHRYFLPYGVKFFDTLKMSKKAFCNDEMYQKFCDENNYKTKNGKNRFTAEILYRFMSGKNDFEEKHTGLEDVLIEAQILKECHRRGVYDGALW